LPVFTGGGCGLHPALGPGAVDDGVLDRLDAHRVVVDVERAGGLAGRRADAAGELGEVVGAVQHLDRACQSPRYTRSLKSGMMLLTGQPLLQNGVPQSMQRAPWTLACSSLRPMTNSL
jgi:hypothetical protein